MEENIAGSLVSKHETLGWQGTAAHCMALVFHAGKGRGGPLFLSLPPPFVRESTVLCLLGLFATGGITGA